MATETQAARERLIEDFKAVMHDAEELLKATSHQTGDKINAVRQRAEESLRQARQKIDEIESSVVDHARSTIKATDQLVHDNPWPSIAIGAAVGFVLGIMAGRR